MNKEPKQGWVEIAVLSVALLLTLAFVFWIGGIIENLFTGSVGGLQ